MSQRVQSFLLRNTVPLQNFWNNNLAQRSGMIGRFFRFYALGERQYGKHSLPPMLKLCNWLYVMTLQLPAGMRGVMSRNMGVTQSPINFTGFMVWIFVTACIISRFRFTRSRDVFMFNAQDSPEFWYQRYGMMFPPSFLHNRVSAHFIEINNIYFVEMHKKY